ncbi:SRPBCC family protein [Jiangella anatolica]|uniref:Carbon monoxide dehydrogenase n=1 Tax=Jiangella anatolica TaxID=2670374 RepID=A0A2W2BMB5_9ACTN|nr:carbon monoxide dehydrogenase subunit G [Jiangella anatolica]PZF81428.1 carbon monoxide dehydrogenase [Jiangella anatolica]
MKVSGTAVLHAPRADVWKALNDPAVLVRTIPGCQRLESSGPDQYRMTVSAGVGTIKGSYDGDVRLHSQREPASFVLTASGAGAPGTVSADVHVTLTDAEDGSTRLEYDADAIVGGMIGGVGQRMLAGVAKKTAGEFFAAVDDVLTGRAPAAPVLAAGPAVPAAAGVYEAPPRPASSAASGDFTRGILVGAAVALAGVALGGWLSGRSRRA